jgi:uncharacterized membrane protein
VNGSIRPQAPDRPCSHRPQRVPVIMLAIIATIIFAVAFVLTIVGVGGVLVASLPLLGLALLALHLAWPLALPGRAG